MRPSFLEKLMPISFERDSGYRLVNKGKSVVISHLALGKPGAVLSDKQILAMTQAMGDYIDALKNRAVLPHKRLEITPVFANPILNDTAFKFTDNDGVNYWMQGNIKLGRTLINWVHMRACF
jgi:hypothetical protein